jgi:uncharacterized protein YndB with AHSA1/START domain
MESLDFSSLLAAPPMRVYSAWINSGELATLTGTRSSVDPQAGGKFLVADGYVQGHFLSLRPFREIVQTWRTADQPCCFADSMLTLLFQPVDCCATRLTMEFTQVPELFVDRCREFWFDTCLEPMRRYFAEG